MSERKIVDWFTMNGKHIPIFEGESKNDAVNRAIAKDNEDKKNSDIKRNQEESEKLNAEKKAASTPKKSDDDQAKKVAEKVKSEKVENHKHPSEEPKKETKKHEPFSKYKKNFPPDEDTDSTLNGKKEQKAALKKLYSFTYGIGHPTSSKALETHPMFDTARKFRDALNEAPDGTALIYDVSRYGLKDGKAVTPSKEYEIFIKSGTGWKMHSVRKDTKTNEIHTAHNTDNVRGIRQIQKFGHFNQQFGMHYYDDLEPDIRQAFEAGLKKKK